MDVVFNDTDLSVFAPEPLVTYSEVGSTNSFSGVPRFGHTSEISKLASSDVSENANYVRGILFVGCFLLVFFLVWSLMLCVFRCCVDSFISGDPFISPYRADRESYMKWEKRPRRVRITFVIAGFILTLFSLLLVTQGVTRLQDTTSIVEDSTEDLQDILDDTRTITENLLRIGNIATALRDQIVVDLDRDNMCPGIPTFETLDTGRALLDAADASVQALGELGGFVEGSIADLESSLDDAENAINDVASMADNMQRYEWIGGFIAFPFLVLTSLMMVGTIAAQGKVMTDCFYRLLSWGVLPLFNLLTTLSWCVCIIVAVLLSLLADFCNGDPGDNIVAMMRELDFDENDLFFQIVRYYVYQCTSAAVVDPYLFLREYNQQLKSSRGTVENLLDLFFERQLIEQLSLDCNRDFEPLSRSLNQMLGVLDSLRTSADRALKLLSCRRVVPIYADLVYEGTCSYLMKGSTWIFVCLLIASTMGLTMVTLRASYQNSQYQSLKHVYDDFEAREQAPAADEDFYQDEPAREGEDAWRDEDQGYGADQRDNYDESYNDADYNYGNYDGDNFNNDSRNRGNQRQSFSGVAGDEADYIPEELDGSLSSNEVSQSVHDRKQPHREPSENSGFQGNGRGGI